MIEKIINKTQITRSKTISSKVPYLSDRQISTHEQQIFYNQRMKKSLKITTHLIRIITYQTIPLHELNPMIPFISKTGIVQFPSNLLQTQLYIDSLRLLKKARWTVKNMEGTNKYKSKSECNLETVNIRPSYYFVNNKSPEE